MPAWMRRIRANSSGRSGFGVWRMVAAPASRWTEIMETLTASHSTWRRLPRGECGIEVEVRFGEIGFDAERLFAMRNRIVEPACAHKDETQIALSAGIGGQAFERFR